MTTPATVGSPTAAKPTFRDTFREFAGASWLTVRRSAGALAAYLIIQTIVVVVLFPLFSGVFRDAVGVAGLSGLDQSNIGALLASPVSGLLIALLAIAAVTATTTQLVLLAAAIRRARAGASTRARELLGDLGRVLKRLIRAGSIGLIVYVFIVLPLGQAGIFSAITKFVAIPSFVTGELFKSTPGIITYLVFLAVIWILNTRFALTLPLLVSTNATGSQAMGLSWRLMKKPLWAFDAVIVCIVLLGVAIGPLVVLLGWIPTWIVENLLGPGPAPLVASLSIGAAVLIGATISGLIIIAIGGALFALLDRHTDALRANARVSLLDPPRPADTARPTEGAPRSRWVRPVTAAIVVLALTGLTALAYPAMSGTAATPSTLILAHRGFDADTPAHPGGVENTISGLEAAHATGADLVEVDVMQTADGRFVMFHDAKLTRLAGVDKALADLTLAELTAITVRDQSGHSDRIPSLADFMARAQELDMRLLIEIKLHGRETPDHVERLVSELEDLGALDQNIYHSLDAHSVSTLKRMRPQLWVGFIMAVASTTPPRTDADFLVVVESSINEQLLRRAHDQGLGVFVWTVNDDQGIRNMLRDEVDGIITDHPDRALAARTTMGPDEPLSHKLADYLRRFVTVL